MRHITRHDFLKRGGAAFAGCLVGSLSSDIAPGADGTALHAFQTPQPRRSTEALPADAWPPELRQYVEERQEGEYVRLASALGLGVDAARAYEQIARPLMPAEHVASTRLNDKSRAQYELSPEQWQQLDRRTAELHQRYFSREAPTRYEDQNRYAVMAMVFDLLHEALVKGGQTLKPRPVVATLPSGDVNARIEREPHTSTHIVFFEQGVFHFLFDFALLAGWALPPLSRGQLNDDLALAGLPRGHRMPPEALKAFATTLYAYVVNGTPRTRGFPIPRPDHNRLTSIVLHGHMSRFVMAHELAHVRLDHLSADASPQQEHEADTAGFELMSAVAHDERDSWAVTFWGCDLALSAFNLFYRAMGILTFGHPRLAWISTTHPNPLARREALRTVWSSPEVPKSAVTAARELCRTTDALIEQLWEPSVLLWRIAYQQGARPSPMWRAMIRHNLAESK